MKKLIYISIAGLLTACNPTAENITPSPYSANNIILPPGLSDCKAYKLITSSWQILFVIRCPNSQTAVNTTGKSATHTQLLEE